MNVEEERREECGRKCEREELGGKETKSKKGKRRNMAEDEYNG